MCACAHMCVCVWHAHCKLVPIEARGVGSFGAGVIGCWELLDLDAGSLERQCELLAVGSSLP